MRSTSQSLEETKQELTQDVTSPTKDPPQDLITSSLSSSTTPTMTSSSNRTRSAATFYTFRAQLTFRLDPSTAGINVADHFTRWAKASFELLPQFSILPFDQDKGLQITNIDQIPAEKSFYSSYFHNHRVSNTVT
jgi:hypothetical protein